MPSQLSEKELENASGGCGTLLALAALNLGLTVGRRQSRTHVQIIEHRYPKKSKKIDDDFEDDYEEK